MEVRRGFPIRGREPVTIYTNSSWENVAEGDASEARWCVTAQSGFHPAERSDDRRLLLAPKGAHASDPPRDARARNPGLIRFSSYNREGQTYDFGGRPKRMNYNGGRRGISWHRANVSRETL